MTKVPDLATMTPDEAMLAWRQWQAGTGKWTADANRLRDRIMYEAAYAVRDAINYYGTLCGSQFEGTGRKILEERLATFEAVYVEVVYMSR